MKLKHLLSVCMLCITAPYAQAQFTPTVIPETFITNSAAVSKTSNDKKIKMNVVAWDGTNPGIFYSIDGTATSGILPLPVGIKMPDVVLSSDLTGGNTWLLAVYLQGSDFVFARYQWDAISNTFLPPVTATTNMGTGIFNASINIDADIVGNYAIAAGFQDGSIDVLYGDNASLPYGAASSGSPLPPYTGGDVDVCLNYNSQAGFGPVGPTNIHIVYGRNNGTYYNGATFDHITVQDIPFGGSAFGTPLDISPVSPNQWWGLPRIASPYFNGNANDRISVVYLQLAPGFNFNVFEYDDMGGSTNTQVLTASAPGFPTPDIAVNKRPAVTFTEKQQQTVITGWAGELTPGNAELLGEKVNPAGGIAGPVTYYGINSTAVPSADYIALSSKYVFSNDVLVSYTNSTGDVYYKIFDGTGPTMRTAHVAAPSVPEGARNVTIYPNPTDGHAYLNAANMPMETAIHLSAADMTGRNVFSYDGRFETAEHAVNGWLAKTAPGMYYLQLSDNEGYSQSLKLVKK